jgi:predicted DNA-binding transcriptional regulator AlpA
LVTAREFAEMLGLDSKTIVRWSKEGFAPSPVRIGKVLRWKRDEVRSWIEAGCPGRLRWLRLHVGKPDCEEAAS